MQEEHLENTLSSLLPAQPPSPASPSQTAGEEGSTEGKGQTDRQTDSTVLLGMGFLGYCLLKHNETTREAHSVKTPLNQIAQ